MQHISALNLSSFRWKFLHRNWKGVSETVPWTFQIVDVIFVLRASRYSLYFESITGNRLLHITMSITVNYYS